MADRKDQDYEAYILKLEEENRALAKQREEDHKQLERKDELLEQNHKLRPTTLDELIQNCHSLLSLPLKIRSKAKSTKGTVPLPTNKYCPLHLRRWEDWPAEQQAIYSLEGSSKRVRKRRLSSEQDTAFYLRVCVEYYVHDIIDEFCKIPAAKSQLGLAEGIQFENHANTLTDDEESESDDSAVRLDYSSTKNPVPDQFCIHRLDKATAVLVASAEYKPPHKLPKRFSV
ncbi:hypothetical protein FQN57_004674 [Myotisia sp. PD_48]|nr:hypothetical protein FQN57_004674 [Myotisia sp. PD_48]